VTGGAGFIGSNFVRKVTSGKFSGIDSIVVVDKLTYSGSLDNLVGVESKQFEFIQADICDEDEMLKISKGCDAIINFAAESHVDRSIISAKEFVNTNVLGVASLLASTLKNGISLFLQVSTDEVYGSIETGSWNEECPVLPNSPYSATKASADLICKSFFRTHGIDVRITRCSNNYGPFQFPEKVIPLFITNLLENKRIPLYGNGENHRDWLYVDDHCSGIYKVLKSGEAGNVYNFGGGQELKNYELAKIILKHLGKDESWINWVPDRLGHDFRYSVDYTKAFNDLGYEPEYEFSATIQNVIAWYIENENWWRKRKK
jgi:dTDP-glucose 4,6-dehydratase